MMAGLPWSYCANGPDVISVRFACENLKTSLILEQGRRLDVSMSDIVRNRQFVPVVLSQKQAYTKVPFVRKGSLNVTSLTT